MKIQLSPKRIIKDAVTVWNEPGPEVDVVMDLRNLTFREGSVDMIYVFHVMDQMFKEDAVTSFKNWFKCLASNGLLHVLSDDFEYIARAFVGGDIDIDLFNDVHNHPMQCTQTGLVKLIRQGGFKDDNGSPEGMPKKHYEFILSANKHETKNS